MKKIISIVCLALIANGANAWEAKVTDMLQHGGWVAVTVTPNPGKMGCDQGSPYLLQVDDSAEYEQKFGMLLSALIAGLTVYGYDDGCASHIWGVPRPVIKRLGVKN